MAKRIGGQNLEGRFFIISVPDNWTENDPLPRPSADDQWFDRLSDFKAVLDCPWIRVPLRYNAETGDTRPAPPPNLNRPRPLATLKPRRLDRAAGE